MTGFAVEKVTLGTVWTLEQGGVGVEVSRWFRGCCLREERMMAGCRVEVLMGSSGPSRNIAETELTDLDVDEREGAIQNHCPFSRITNWMNGIAFYWKRVSRMDSNLEREDFEFPLDSGCRGDFQVQ